MRQIRGTIVLLFFFALVFASRANAQGMRMSAEERVKMLKDSLSLTKVQADSVVKILQESDKERQAMMSSDNSDRQARMDAMRSLRDKTDAKIGALLTPEQKTKYEAMRKQQQERMQQRMQRRPD